MLWFVYPLLLEIMAKQGYETAVALSDSRESDSGVHEVKEQTESNDSFQRIPDQEPLTQDQSCSKLSSQLQGTH